ncbi:hypothetical protein VPH35_076575 [Triticum aestivum]
MKAGTSIFFCYYYLGFAGQLNFATTVFNFCWNQQSFCYHYLLFLLELDPILLPSPSIFAGTSNIFCYHYLLFLLEPAPILLQPPSTFAGTSNPFFATISFVRKRHRHRH